MDMFDLKHTLRYQDYLFKYIKIKSVDGKQHEGWLKALDPLTGNLIVLNFNDEYDVVTDATLVMDHGIRSVEMIKDSDAKIKSLVGNLYFPPKVTRSERRQQLIELIKKHKLRFHENIENESVEVFGITIPPPYDARSCFGENKIVLRRIKGLVNSLPEAVVVDVPPSPYDASLSYDERKELLVSWIKKNRLPVYEDEDESLIVLESVTIVAPYNIHNCSSSNETDLKIVQDLIANVPSKVSAPYAESLTHSERKEQLIAWIKKHRLPLCENEDQSLLVCESVTIDPPYDIENCSSSNERVLKNIKRLVANLPPAVSHEVPSSTQHG